MFRHLCPCIKKLMEECHLPITCHVKVTITRAAEHLDDLLDIPNTHLSASSKEPYVEAREQSEASCFFLVRVGSVSSGASAPNPYAPSHMPAVPLPGTAFTNRYKELHSSYLFEKYLIGGGGACYECLCSSHTPRLSTMQSLLGVLKIPKT